MNAPLAMACDIVSIAGFYAIAEERARSYGHALVLRRASAVVPAVGGAALCAWLISRGTAGPATIVLAACTAASSTSDLQTGLVFDRVLGIAAIVLIVVAIAEGRPIDAALGAALSGGLPAIAYVLGRGRTLGFGDVKLAAVIGLGLGPAAALAALWFAVVSAGSVGLGLLLSGRAALKSELRLAPYLAIGVCAEVLHR
jgi:prepilin signal peptidase PulO-like enzyme (type II secretory pathway)